MDSKDVPLSLYGWRPSWIWPKKRVKGVEKFEPYDFLVIWSLMMQYPPLTQFGQTNLAKLHLSLYLSQCWPRSMSPYGVTRRHNELLYATSDCVGRNEHVFPCRVTSFLCRVWVRVHTSAVRAFYHIRACQMNHHWFRWWLVACSTPDHLIQYCMTCNPTGIQFLSQEYGPEMSSVLWRPVCTGPNALHACFIFIWCILYACKTQLRAWN